ncbi:HNH endonuclease [Microbacterium oxydans]|uniref:HNH endonuclease n=1 Tax=Microbacterium oxydans TaxID=82380 RepID=UPI0036424A46
MPRVYTSTSRVAVPDPLLSAEDADLKSWCWRIGTNGYVVRGERREAGRPRSGVRLHTEVLERVIGRTLRQGELVDHINGVKADNRRENLRLANKSQNAINSKPRGGTSRYRGVSWSSERSLFQTYINSSGQRLPIGRFNSEDEAAWMYDQFAIELHGDFARLNLDYLEVEAQR